MFTIRFGTERFAPTLTVGLRWSPHWEIERGGTYSDGAWRFELDETSFPPEGITFRFVLAPDRRMRADDFHLPRSACAGTVPYSDNGDPNFFGPATSPSIEHGSVARLYFPRNLDPEHVYDVIVVGSGMGGGMLAARLSDLGKDVLVLEAGPYLFPTHVANFARRLILGQFQKHVWSLWYDFLVKNYDPSLSKGYDGGQAFNLGGRSVFWGGLIPRQSTWELDAWPADVRADLARPYYALAEGQLNRAQPRRTSYQRESETRLRYLFPDWSVQAAPMAIQYRGPSSWSVPAGMFSTVERLMEDRLVVNPPTGIAPPTVNLDFAVRTIDLEDKTARGITGVDYLSKDEDDEKLPRKRSFRARNVVLSAGALETPKIAINSGLEALPNIGRGLTDHTILYKHFVVQPPSDDPVESAKILMRHPAATPSWHAFDVVVELGANLNQGLYIDPVHLRQDTGGKMMCEIVFMFYAALRDDNTVTLNPAAADNPVVVNMQPVDPTATDRAEAAAMAVAVFSELGAEPVPGEPTSLDVLDVAVLGGVSHEVGTMRLGDDASAVVDPNLKLIGYDNIYVCDNSVFPASAAANPSLTLVALALRLADHLNR